MEVKNEHFERGRFEGQVLQKLADIEREIKDGRQRSDKKHTELKQEFHDTVSSLEGRVIINADKISVLERWRWWLMGGVGVIAFLVTFFANVLANRF